MKEAAAPKAGLAKGATEEAAPEPRVCPFCRQQIDEAATRCPIARASSPATATTQKGRWM